MREAIQARELEEEERREDSRAREPRQSSPTVLQSAREEWDRQADNDVEIVEVRNNNAGSTSTTNNTSRIPDDIEPLSFEELCLKKAGVLYVEKLDDKPSTPKDTKHIPHPQKCPICQNDLGGEVDLLKCRHVLCRICADKMRRSTFIARWNAEHDLDIGTFPCPLCRENVRTTYRYTSYVNYKTARENREKTMSQKTLGKIAKKRAKNQRRREKSGN